MPLTPASRATVSVSMGWVSFIGYIRGEHEQRADAFEGCAQRIRIGEVAANCRHASGKLCRPQASASGRGRRRCGFADEQDLRPDGTCAACHENGHGKVSLR